MARSNTQCIYFKYIKQINSNLKNANIVLIEQLMLQNSGIKFCTQNIIILVSSKLMKQYFAHLISAPKRLHNPSL